MATTTSDAEVHSESLNFKTWVLKVSIHCVGCKKKVKKLLNSVPGVSTIDIDAKQHRVVVTGNVEGDALLRKLFKSGKHAELVLPEKNHPETSAPNTQLENGNSSKDIAPTKDVKQPPLDTIKPTHIAAAAAAAGSGNSVKNIEGVSAGTSSSSGGAKATAAADKSIKLDKLTKEPKVEEKKPETDQSSNQTSPPVMEVKDGQTEKNGGGGGVVGGGSGTVGKKKKKKGQNGNSTVAEPSSAESPKSGVPPPAAVSPSNDSPPRHYGYSYPPQGPPPSHYYAPPPAPVYGVSYNTAQPSSSYTASYYASPPPQSYAYAYPGEEMGPPRAPPPSDYDAYPRQPLDSFEMFSDENPNGCSVM